MALAEFFRVYFPNDRLCHVASRASGYHAKAIPLCRVLLVDGDEKSRRLNLATLTDAGCQVMQLGMALPLGGAERPSSKQ